MDLCGAIAAGLLMTAIELILHSRDGYTFRDYAGYALLFVSSYSAIVIFSYRFWSSTMRFRWLAIAVGGTFLFLVLTYLPAVIKESYYGLSGNESVSAGYVHARFEEFGLLFIVFSLLTLPVTAAYHYLNRIARRYFE